MNLIKHLLYKNLSRAQLAGFVLSNFAGLAILVLGIQFWLDARHIWEDEDSFIRKDYLVINRRVTGANTLGGSSGFTPAMIEEISSQPWVRKSAPFTSARYPVTAAVDAGGRRLYTSMFLESIPAAYIDAAGADWGYTPGQKAVPVIISKDYLSLYNFGFAGSAGLEQLSEGTVGAVPLTLTLHSAHGPQTMQVTAYIAGFSSRLNTILVPQEFMDWSNSLFADPGVQTEPSRIIIDVNSPGDAKITEFMKSHGYEVAGDKGGTSAAFLVNIISAVVLAVGALITVLSFFILMLSMNLLMQKNRAKIHSLIMLGVELRTIAGTYIRLVAGVNALAFLLAAGAMAAIRSYYLGSLRALGAEGGWPWVSVCAGLLTASVITLLNARSISRRVRSAFRN